MAKLKFTIQTDYPAATELVRLPDGFAIHRAATVTLDSSKAPYIVVVDVEELGGQTICRALRCEQRPGGEPVTSEGLRRGVPVARLLRIASAQLVLKETAGGGFEPVSTPQDWQAFERAYEAAGAKRRRRTLDSDLERVPEIYRRALRLGNSPTLAVAKALGISRSAAARRVIKAREDGLLGKARPGRKGEFDE